MTPFPTAFTDNERKGVCGVLAPNGISAGRPAGKHCSGPDVDDGTLGSDGGRKGDGGKRMIERDLGKGGQNGEGRLMEGEGEGGVEGGAQFLGGHLGGGATIPRGEQFGERIL